MAVLRPCGAQTTRMIQLLRRPLFAPLLHPQNSLIHIHQILLAGVIVMFCTERLLAVLLYHLQSSNRISINPSA
jgi:hypothetical protein